MEATESPQSLSVRVGRITVRIYHRPAERRRNERWRVADYSTGKRVLRSFDDLATAKAEATRIGQLLRAGDTEGAGMTGDDRRDLVRATELVAPLKLDVPTVCALFAEAADLVGSHSVVTAAREFAKRHPAGRLRKPLSEAADEYKDAKAAKGRSPRLLSDIRCRLGRFVLEHPGKAVGDFSTADVQRWIDGLKRQDGKPMSALGRRNFAVVIGGFFEHCRRRGFIGENPTRDLERESIRATGDVEFWTLEEAQKLLAAADPVVLPALAVALFAGCRTAEISRLTWGDIDFAAGHIVVGAGKAKTASRRLAPLPENLRAWLEPARKAAEKPLFADHHSRLPRRVTEACTRANVRRLSNGPRHSFITHRVALLADVPRVALEAGTSPKMVFAHYRGLTSEKEASRWFELRPAGTPANVITLTPAVA